MLSHATIFAFASLICAAIPHPTFEVARHALDSNHTSNLTHQSHQNNLQPRVWPFSETPDVPWPIDSKRIPDSTRIKYTIDANQPWRLWDTRQWRTKGQAKKTPKFNEFQITRYLGQGISHVYQVLWNNRRIYAAKAHWRMFTEIDVMRYIDDSLSVEAHTNVLRFQNAVFLDMPKQETYLTEFMIIEYCNRGDAHKIVTTRLRQDSSYTESLLLDILTQIASGMKALHAIPVFHLDLKPANILLKDDFSNTRSGLLVKIADFGHAGTRQKENGDAGTRGYHAPEQLTALLTGNAFYDAEQADIWALGATFFELATGQQIYKEIYHRPSWTLDPDYLANPQKWFSSLIFTDVAGNPNRQFSPEFIDLLVGMLRPRLGSSLSSRRLDARQIFRRLLRMERVYAKDQDRGGRGNALRTVLRKIKDRLGRVREGGGTPGKREEARV